MSTTRKRSLALMEQGGNSGAINANDVLGNAFNTASKSNEQDTEERVESFLEKHRVQEMIEEALEECVKSEAQDPRSFIGNYLLKSTTVSSDNTRKRKLNALLNDLRTGHIDKETYLEIVAKQY